MPDLRQLTQTFVDLADTLVDRTAARANSLRPDQCPTGGGRRTARITARQDLRIESQYPRLCDR